MIGKRSRQVLTGRGDRLLVVYLCRLKVCRVCVAPFGTDLGLGKKGARIGKAGNGLRTLENVFAG